MSILLIAVALAMDAFAVSVASGIAIRHLRIRHAVTVALWFAVFQALMPVLGWAGGLHLQRFLHRIDHWVACGLLAALGLKLIAESFRLEKVEQARDPLDVSVLFVLSIATSLDALAAGVSFAMLRLSIVRPVVVIGLVTFAMCFAGVWIGHRWGHACERHVERLAGLILIGLGLKILVSHLAGWSV